MIECYFLYVNLCKRKYCYVYLVRSSLRFILVKKTNLKNFNITRAAIHVTVHFSCAVSWNTISTFPFLIKWYDLAQLFLGFYFISLSFINFIFPCNDVLILWNFASTSEKQLRNNVKIIIWWKSCSLSCSLIYEIDDKMAACHVFFCYCTLLKTL